ncbi:MULTISPECIES: hypothetical protein [Gimesia]|uniref:Uncharacterized protein n=2 Tax=Gimesia TaxID=1649453 RepID=A0A517VER8_9PLAN|nr:MULTISPECIES: hypothetical protein [Gimesia]QDT91508.1 hypothetical protein Pan161_31660 [Gimesia algae]QDV48378.1 hypothetical protein Enr17x_03900 [Gimesia fumaroli]
MSNYAIVRAYTFDDLTESAQNVVLSYDEHPSKSDAVYNADGELIDNDVLWNFDFNVTFSMLRAIPELLKAIANTKDK